MRIAALLALLGASLPQEPPTSELVSEFLKGSAPARERLLKRGPDALLHLLEARRAKPDHPRGAELDALVFDLQEAAAGERGKAVFRKLREIRVTIDMRDAPLSAVLDYLREITELNIFADPASDPDRAVLTIKLMDAPLKDALRTICVRTRTDFDLRYGVFFVAPHERLWGAPREEPIKPLSPEQAADARKWIAKLSAEPVVEREAATTGLRKLGPAAFPILEEGAKGTDAEAAARCRTLAEELRPKPRTWGTLSAVAHWRGQKLEGADLKVADTLQRKKIHLAFENSELTDILAFIRDFSELKIVVAGVLPKTPMTIKVRDLPLGEVLELLALLYGLDVRIENEQVTIFERKK